jgi:hypothetical protein
MEPQVLNTDLTNFHYNSIEQHGPVPMEWWLLNENEEAPGFNNAELKLFIDYTVSTPNFAGNKNALNASPGGEPGLEIFDLDAIDKRPAYLILRKIPKVGGQLFRSTDIILTDGHGEDRHNYHLPFEK